MKNNFNLKVIQIWYLF